MANIISTLHERGLQADSWKEDIEAFIKCFVDNVNKTQSTKQIKEYIFLINLILKVDECTHEKLQVSATLSLTLTPLLGVEILKLWNELYVVCYSPKGKYLIEPNKDKTFDLLFFCNHCSIQNFIKVKIEDLVLKKETGYAYIFNYNKKSEKGLKPKFINPQKTKITSAQKTKLLLNMIMCKGMLKEKK